ncbi:hypothetical protein BMF94_1424 [Rhodotorula taiwanensis]|uniref:Uncharacterized protein n=1 Tax=Rhodotorula taiwanensis TaxID=741276 RepID=A0A2S5BFH4_9BASI|nr:hypothetical protein BMF94_1424 [Rhodotorula taiwanensis]
MVAAHETVVNHYTDDDIALKEVGSDEPLLDPGRTDAWPGTPALLPSRLRRGKTSTGSPIVYTASAIVLVSLLVLASRVHTGVRSDWLPRWPFKLSRSWSPEEKALREYRWTAPPVDPTLVQKLDELSPAQNRVRNWLLEQRLETMGGIGVGLSATAPLDPRPPLASHAHPFEFAGEYEGPGVYINGSREKYGDLLYEWRFGRPVGVCEVGEWQLPYARMHADMLNGARAPRLLEYVCLAGHMCGGYADRMLGMTTALLFSIISGRAFLAHWGQPAPLDLIFDSPFIDWSRPYNVSSETSFAAGHALVTDRTTIHTLNQGSAGLDYMLPGLVDSLMANGSSRWAQLDANRGTVLRSFTYPSVRPHLDRLGLTPTNAYSCLINYAFRPKRAALAFIAQYTSYFALPENFVVGIQIRTGDKSMESAGWDRHTVAQYQYYFTCAEQLAMTYARPTQRVVYYLITDSNDLEQDAKRVLGNRVVVTGLEQAHAEIKANSSNVDDSIRRATDGFMRTIAESWIFAGTDYQILTANSGFGKIPTWQRGRDNTTVLNPRANCSLPSTLQTFVDMAQGWSFG